jgi:hypothetical protein
MFEAVCASECDLLFSIQGKIDSDLICRFKERRPDLKIVYWLGDVLVEPTRRRLETLRAACQSGDLDCLLVSYRGTYDQLCNDGYKNVRYFPFGVSKKYHSLGTISEADREAFTSKVSFVGSCYPERAELIRYLNNHLDEPVRVWGRGWRKEGIHSQGSLDIADSLKVHACSQVSLNIHHHLTDSGFNMKFYEIPAVGGMQLCDWQKELEVFPFQGVMKSFKDRENLLALIRFYLSHEAERLSLADKTNQIVWNECDYSDQISELMQSLNI